MANNTLNARIILCNDTTVNWGTSEKILLKSEFGIELTDGTPKFKIGDGVNKFADLPYATLTPSEIENKISTAVENAKHTHSNKSILDAITAAFTTQLKSNYDAAYTHSQTEHAPSNAQANVIETIKVNGTTQTPSNKEVDITIPTKVSDLTNDSGFKTTDTWRGIQDNLTSESTADSLSANQGKVLKGLIDGKAASVHSHTKSQISDFPTSLPANGGNSSTVNGHTVKSDVPENAKFTDTWRGVQDNLTSSSAVDSLSANQGKVLKELIDGKSNSGHTHDQYYDSGISRTKNTVLAAPNGSNGSATFRTLVANDIPSLTKSKISDFPTSMPASDVPSWAKASTKPSYSWSEIGSKPSTFTPASHTHGNADITGLDCGKLTGTLDIARLPQGALDRLVKVADDTARFKLTSATVQLGDTVKVTNTGKMYIVVDESKLSEETGYEVYTADTAASVPWSGITGKPTSFTPASHTHDDRYYTESEMNTKLSGKANSSHTHNYAGSSSAGGSATSAVKLDTDTAGSATQPVYFADGKPAACAYTLGKSVPSNAVFTDTTYKVFKGSSNGIGESGLVPAPSLSPYRVLYSGGDWGDVWENSIVENIATTTETKTYLGIS